MPGGAPAGGPRRPASSPRSISCFQVASATSPAGASSGSTRRGVLGRERGALAVPAADLLHLHARLGDGAEAERVGPAPRRCRPAPAGRAGSPGCRAPVSKDRSRPSQLTNVPALSVTGATGKTTSAARVTSVSRSSSATTNRAASRAARVAAGSAVSSGSTPPMTRPPSSPAARAATIASASRPARRRAGGRRPTRWRRRRGRRRRRPDGRRAAGWAGSRSRPRRGHRRDAGPRPAGHRSSRPVRPRRVRAPGEVARRSPTRITAVLSTPYSPCSTSASERRGLVAGAGRRSAGRSSCAGRARCTARGRRRGCPCGTPCAAAGRSRRPRPRARGRRGRRWRRSRGRRTRRDGGARPRRRGSAPPRRRCGRARKSMSLVPSATRANLL